MDIRVLLAASTEDQREMLTKLLDSEPDLCAVGCTGDGLDTLQIARTMCPDVIVLDAVLTGIDGLGVLERLGVRDGEKPAIIMLSSFASTPVISAAHTLGAAFFLQVPCDPQILVSRIRQSVGMYVPAPLQKHCSSLESTVTEIIHTLGIPAHYKGYAYLRDAILLVVDHADIINAVTKELYPTVAKRFSVTPSRVERAIRHGIETAWERCDIEILREYFGQAALTRRRKPTNSEFIAMLADRLSMQRKERHG